MVPSGSGNSTNRRVGRPGPMASSAGCDTQATPRLRSVATSASTSSVPRANRQMPTVVAARAGLHVDRGAVGVRRRPCRRPWCAEAKPAESERRAGAPGNRSGNLPLEQVDDRSAEARWSAHHPRVPLRGLEAEGGPRLGRDGRGPGGGGEADLVAVEGQRAVEIGAVDVDVDHATGTDRHGPTLRDTVPVNEARPGVASTLPSRATARPSPPVPPRMSKG